MLDVYIHNLLTLKSFHGVWARNARECLLKFSIGKARDLFNNMFLHILDHI